MEKSSLGVCEMETMTKSWLGRNKKWGPSGYWKSKRSGSSPAKHKSLRRSASVVDNTSLWRMNPEGNVAGMDSSRNSELVERDSFLDLLCKVQDNRYDNQRYVLKTGGLHETRSNTSTPDESQDGASDIIQVNGTLPNGGRVLTPDIHVPIIEIYSGSPENTRRTETPGKNIANGDLSSSSFCGSGESMRAGSVDAGSEGTRDEEDRESLSPPPLLQASTTLTPSRKSMEALKKVLSEGGPYPLLVEPPVGGFWIQNGEYESACGEDGQWKASEISTEHYRLDVDKTALMYGRHCIGQPHKNFIARDSNVGHLLLSVKFEEDYQGTSVRLLLRTEKETMYTYLPLSQVPDNVVDPEDYIKFVYASKHPDEDLNIERAIRIYYPKAPELIHKFDEHTLVNTHKFGVIYQQIGQTSEEDLFGTVNHPPALEEFLEILGDKIQLKGFKGYRGGLDVVNNQTGDSSVYTEFKDREIMFHVSTLLPHDPTDSQHVQRKRHIGNDIVVIVFQDANTPFCPTTVRSHFVHSYIVVQVEHPNTDHTVYKVAVAGKDHVPEFGPPLPDPAVFQKGPEFRDWLLSKILNAEFNSHLAPDFKKLAMRTRSQLFSQLVDEITQTMEDVDYPSLGLDGGKSPLRRRRRTLAGIFAKKENMSLLPAFPKRKSFSGSPKTIRRLLSPEHRRLEHITSTPDLTNADTPDGKQSFPSSLNSLTLANTKIDHLSSPDREGGSANKAKVKRRFTFRSKEKDKRKKPKRKGSETPTLTSSLELFSGKLKQRRATTSSPLRTRSNDSSEESSISSGLNWSIPSDLPGAVEAQLGQRHHGRRGLERGRMSVGDHGGMLASLRARWRSTPTIFERKESSDSSVSVSDVRILNDGPLTADVAIQGNAKDRVFKFPSPISPISPPEILNDRDALSRSLPGTPEKVRQARTLSSKLRKLPTTQEVRQRYNRRSSSPIRSQLVYTRSLRSKHRNGDVSELENRPLSSQGFSSPMGHSSEEERVEKRHVFRAESTDSVSAEADEVYESLLQSLHGLTMEVTRLRQQNLTLCTENVRFASQNRRLRVRYSEVKHQLLEAQQQVHTLQLKLRLYQPSFPDED